MSERLTGRLHALIALPRSLFCMQSAEQELCSRGSETDYSLRQVIIVVLWERWNNVVTLNVGNKHPIPFTLHVLYK